MKLLYSILLLGTIAVPLIRSFESKVDYVSRWKYLFVAIGVTASFFLIWDVWFTNAGIWGFNDRYLIGWRIFSLPIEEWLFFIVVPFASVFIYDCMVYLLPPFKEYGVMRWLVVVLGVGLIFLAIMNIEHGYTLWNFMIGGVILLLLAFFNPSWMSKFWIAYFLHLIPFFIVNGFLTGSFTEQPVVWYNASEIIGIRLLNIPVEDTIYALSLLLMNVLVYESLQSISPFEFNNWKKIKEYDA